jgi:hypothetical protein
MKPPSFPAVADNQTPPFSDGGNRRSNLTVWNAPSTPVHCCFAETSGKPVRGVD